MPYLVTRCPLCPRKIRQDFKEGLVGDMEQAENHARSRMGQHLWSKHEQSHDPGVYDRMVKALTVQSHSLEAKRAFAAAAGSRCRQPSVPRSMACREPQRAVPHVRLLAVPKAHLKLLATQGLTREEAQERFARAIYTQREATSQSDPPVPEVLPTETQHLTRTRAYNEMVAAIRAYNELVAALHTSHHKKLEQERVNAEKDKEKEKNKEKAKEPEKEKQKDEREEMGWPSSSAWAL